MAVCASEESYCILYYYINGLYFHSSGNMNYVSTVTKKNTNIQNYTLMKPMCVYTYRIIS